MAAGRDKTGTGGTAETAGDAGVVGASTRSQAEWRAELARRKAELEERIARVHGDLVHAEIPLEHDFAEQAVQREEDEVLAQLEASARAELARIRRALLRAEQGEYGICANCGEAIEPARLAVVPDTETCVVCAEDPGPR